MDSKIICDTFGGPPRPSPFPFAELSSTCYSLCPRRIGNRLRPIMAGDWHSVRLRVRARRAFASRSRCMGLFADFSIFSPPGMLVDMVGDNRLPAFVHVNVFDGLLPRLVQFRQRLQRCAAIGLSLEGEFCVAVRAF